MGSSRSRIDYRHFFWLLTVAHFAIGYPALAGQPASQVSIVKSSVSTKPIVEQPNHARVRLQINNGRIGLEARQAPWSQLLNTIEQQTGVRFHYASLPVYPVSISLKGRTAQELLTHLFGSATGYACRFSKSTKQSASGWPEEIWVMDIITSNNQNPSPPMSAFPQSVNDLSDEQLEEAVQLQYQRELENLLDKAKNGTLDEKNQALVELSTRPEDEANKAEMQALLKEGLHNEDPDVRGQIVYSLGNQGGLESNAILEDGLKDEALGVRVSAVNAISAGEAEGQKLLRQALNDSDATVRSIAEEKLKEVGISAKKF